MLSQSLSAKKNNLDLLRLIAASAVIYGHAPALTGKPHFDFVWYLARGHDYSGSLAVKFFFFISGLLVTVSLLKSRSIVEWSLARILRVGPGYAVAMVVTAMIIMPLFSDLGFGILGTAAPYHYIWKNILALFNIGNITFRVDGVFSGFPKTAPNGSIWTLPFEMRAYFFLGCLFLIGGFSHKRVASAAILVLIVVESVAPNATRLFGANPATSGLLPCFAAGVLAAFWADKIALRFDIFACLFAAAIIMSPTAAYPVFYCASVFYGALLLSAQEWFLALKPRCDISYGVYLYGWPVQMVVFGLWPWLPVNAHIVVALVLAAALGLASWVLVEKRAKLGSSPRMAKDGTVPNVAALDAS